MDALTNHGLDGHTRKVRRAQRAHVMAAALGGALRLLRRWHNRQRARAELNALDDRLLRDIGLRRDSISCVLSRGDCRPG